MLHQTNQETIRQGHPVSPYLFLLCAQNLSTQLKQEDRETNIHGVSIGRWGAKNKSYVVLQLMEECHFLQRIFIRL